ncbi:deleted in malignant brain tumors 1 protein-like isoform X2 [Pomacea canaliculata]|uniref:deleted in malignant brain tumors 1 protein-like isoform X2 n=1 Tax=Pomacea canaliculata TaxID=400727 RepID=UPI000D72C83E|nr:deleted in malignant brain tumors 1 protein-like isoform X2 [Pomacea canaliculata]
MKARVVNGTSEAGRLEIFYNGKWATVCGWGFVKNEAQVACKMLGYNSTEVAAVSSVRYGRGTGFVLPHIFTCQGIESSLAQCKLEQLFSRGCDHENDVGVVCNITEHMTARLVNGTSEAGRLEIFFNREWSTVCNLGFGNNEAQVACKMLGYESTGAAVVSSVRYGQGAGHVLFNYVVCQGTETSLWQCNLGDLYSRECGHTYDVGVVCNITEQIEARLVNGTSTAGRLEIFFNREWGTVCGYLFGDKEAQVACNMLGYNSSRAAAVSSVRYGHGAGPVLLSRVECQGAESSLAQCNLGELYSNCKEEYSVGVVCNITSPMETRLVGGASEAAGRLEIFFNDEWSTVCQDEFGKSEMKVACRMLGFNSTRQALVKSLIFGEGSEHQFKQVSCQGMESSLEQCEFGLIREKDCKDVGIICDFKNFSLHLTGPGRTSVDTGRVDVDVGSGRFSTVCITNEKTAGVICRQLNLPSQ